MKIKKKIVIPVVAVTVLIVIVLLSLSGKDKEYVTELKRPSIDEESKVYPLEMEVDGTKIDVEVPVEPETINEEELPEYFGRAYEILFEKVKGQNESYEEITEDLNFVKSIKEYGMKVEYELDEYDIVGMDGNIDRSAIDAPYRTCIYVTIRYEEFAQLYVFPIVVLPEEKTEASIWNEKVQKNLTGNGKTIDLPKEIDGRSVKFSKKKSSNAGLLLLIPLGAGVVIYCRKVYKPKKQKEERENQLKEDYSEIVSKVSLLMGAGMSGSRAFKRISRDYCMQLDSKKVTKRAAYEEVNVMVNQIDNGVSEELAYENFGRSCREHSYIKLANLMVQNIKKGSSEFNSIISNEVTNAFEERKAMARQRGEKAGTKLLLPMIMMLSIVLIIIIVPAFMSF